MATMSSSGTGIKPPPEAQSAAKQEAERKRIEAEGIRDFQNTVTPGISENFLRWEGN